MGLAKLADDPLNGRNVATALDQLHGLFDLGGEETVGAWAVDTLAQHRECSTGAGGRLAVAHVQRTGGGEDLDAEHRRMGEAGMEIPRALGQAEMQMRGARGALQEGQTLSAWHARIDEVAPLSVASLVAELSVAPLPVVHDQSTGLPPAAYTRSLLVRVREVAIGRRISDAMSQMRRMAADPAADQAHLRELSLSLQQLERQRATLREELV